LIQKEWEIWSTTIYIDNQASIIAIQLTKPTTAHFTFHVFHENITMLLKKHHGQQITIRWAPGHKGMEGNEQADEQAKKVITEGSSNVKEL
jgi:ribonuclease HI